ncbi:helix-turn-helix domain-containing protein [Roseomonas sp. GC11]|nr:helix-turn-helix domain-containing protein [Roseomonas sp. GC11]
MNICRDEAASSKPAPLLLSLAEAGRLLGLSSATIRRRINDGSLTSVQIGGRRLVHAAAVEKLARGGTAE